MKRIMISRNFMQTHSRAGDPTFFVEKIWKCVGIPENAKDLLPEQFETYLNISGNFIPKQHTVRHGQRYKDGETVQLFAWEGMPYRSPQIPICAPLKVYVIDFEMKVINGATHHSLPYEGTEIINEIAMNDGLGTADFVEWLGLLKKPYEFAGQIVIWGDVEYKVFSKKQKEVNRLINL